MKINRLESFNPFRDRNVAGEKPCYFLKKKLEALGYDIKKDNHIEINEDAFYLAEEDLNRLVNNINHNYRQINDECDFYDATSEIKMQINRAYLKAGVKLLSLENIYIDEKAVIVKGATIYPNTYIEGNCVIGTNSVIGSESKITNATIGKNTKILKSVVVNSEIGDYCDIGPYSYIRPESQIKNHVKIGDFVEIKKSVINERTKIPHLTYIGDSEVGRNVNVACGVMTANYDGNNKYKTVIGDNAFVGCNVTMVSPVKIENNAYIAAGSTITTDVPANSLAVARERQINKKDWVSKNGFKRIEKE